MPVTTATTLSRPRARLSPPPLAGWLRPVAAAASGLCVALAFPPVGAVALLPVGLAGLMLCVRGARGRVGFGLGLLFGLGFMLPLLRWLTVIGVDAWIGLSLAESLFYAAMAMTWVWMRPYRWWPLGYALAWVAAEWLRASVPFGGMPWGRVAFGVVDTTAARFGRIGGTALVALVVVFGVAAVVNAVERRRALRWPDLTALGAVGALVAIGFAIPTGPAGAVGTAQVAAIQGNVPGDGMDAFAERRAVLDNHATTTREFADRVGAGVEPAPDFVIWPENSTDIDPFTDSSAYDEIDAAVRAIGVPVLVGAVVDGPDDQHVQNMGIVWDPESGPGAQYVKRHPVPFGEYIPFRGLLTRFIDRLGQIPRDFAQGTRPGVLDVAGVPIGDVICFEVAYDGLVRDVVSGGGQLLVVQTNNATYAGTGQLDQQFAISRYRAIETGRTVVAAATNGISGVVASDGTVVAEAAPRTQAVLNEPVTLADGVTWGTRLGFWVEVALALLGIGLAVWAGLGARRRAGRLAG